MENMGEKIYTLTRIEGEYAYLSEDGSSEELFIAMYLLPLGADIGAKLSYKNLEFSLID